jgi:hypothetical protein
MRIKPTNEEKIEVCKIMAMSRDGKYNTLVKLIRRINYLEGKDFYEAIYEDIIKKLRKQTRIEKVKKEKILKDFTEWLDNNGEHSDILKINAELKKKITPTPTKTKLIKYFGFSCKIRG